MTEPERESARDEVVRAVAGPHGNRQTAEIAFGVLALVTGMIDASWLMEPGERLIVLPATLAQVGMVLLLRGLMPLVSGTKPGAKAGSVLPAFGYKTFVAWRYLMVNPPRVGRVVYALIGAGIGAAVLLGVTIWLVGVSGDDLKHPLVIAQWLASMFAFGVIWVGMMRFSRPARWVFVMGYIAMLLCLVAMDRIIKDKLPFIDLELDDKTPILQGFAIAMMISAVVAFISLVAGMLRSVFTFFTTVPIVGVWIGTAALVIVLSVMSGFESDLRQKILGSNAHVQVTREDGDFTEWRDVKKRLDKLPGIVASTPFAVSEVVIAANNNGMPVIIKGIDPATVGNVTDLVSDLEDRDAIKRLDPLVDDTYDRRVPQTPRKPTGKVVDPPPSDMPTGGDPIDFSHPSTPPPDLEPPAPPPPDDARNVVDPPPPDLLSSDEPPTDYSGSGSDLSIHVADTIDSSISRRTQALPGVLVGRELVKQTHLYTGEEVRVVSPLSDSANPDATGTPIPFNRDYRVAGVFYTGMYEYDLKFVYVSLESLQVFLDRGDAVDGIEVRVTDPDDSDHFVDMIGAELGPAYRVQDWNTLNRSLFSALKLEKIAMFAVLGIVILVASFSIVGNLIMVVVEKAREIALLKTLGASDMGVMQLFAVQGLLIGVMGTIIGVATGLGGCLFAQRYGLPLDPNVYYIDRLPINIDPSSVTAAALAGVLVSLAATLYPAMLAARVRPAAGMRH